VICRHDTIVRVNIELGQRTDINFEFFLLGDLRRQRIVQRMDALDDDRLIAANPSQAFAVFLMPF